MKFRTQLLVGMGALIAITLCTAAVAVTTMRNTARHASDLTHEIVEELSAVHGVRLRAEQLVSAARGYLLTNDKSLLYVFGQRQAQLEASLENLSKRSEIPDPLLATQLALVEQTLRAYGEAIGRAASMRLEGVPLAQLEAAFEDTIRAHRIALDNAVDALTETEHARLTSLKAQASDRTRTFSITLLIAWACGVAISIVLAVVVMRRLNAQYARVREAERAAARAAAARKQLLDVVAHDLLSPLNAVVLASEVMEMDHPDARHVKTISNATAAMQRLVTDLLDVSRAESNRLVLARTDSDVGAVLARTVDLFRYRAQRGRARVRVECPAELRAYIDGDRVAQILSNLVGNALKFARPDDEIVVRATATDASLRIEVIDNGPGIAEAERVALFDAYRQGTRGTRKEGLGLGLFISRKLVEAHGGRIGVDSTPGHGSTFWFELPRAAS